MGRRRSFGNEAEPQEFHLEDPKEPNDPELSRGPTLVSHISDESSVMPLPSHLEEEEAEADEMWDMDWTAVAGASRGPVPPFHPPHRTEQNTAQTRMMDEDQGAQISNGGR
ncbi:Putative polyamine oxidase 4 [Durusdinium trenchii]